MPTLSRPAVSFLAKLLSWLAPFAAAGCSHEAGAGSGAGSGAGTGTSAFAQNDSPENLKSLLAAIVAANKAGDHKKAAALTRDLIPDRAALAKALRDGAAATEVEAVEATTKGLPADDVQLAGVIQPGEAGRTEIQVHGATTEEIAKYEKGGVAHSEFPGGAQKLAAQVLRPGCKFYEVEFLEPGKDSGMKYHLFFFDGGRWRMLGPAWRGK